MTHLEDRFLFFDTFGVTLDIPTKGVVPSFEDTFGDVGAMDRHSLLSDTDRNGAQ